MLQRHIDQDIYRLAAPAGSVVHARDLRAAGISRDAIALRVRRGVMHPILPRTYAVGPLCMNPTLEMRCMAGVLAGGAGSMIDGEVAATLLGLWDRSSLECLDVTVAGTVPRIRHEEFRFHRSREWDRPTGKLLRSGPIPVAPVTELVLRLAASLTKWQLAFVIQRGVYLRLVTLVELDAVILAGTRTPWISVLRDAIALVRSGSVGTRGRSEDLLVAALERAGVPEPIVNTRGAMGMSRDEPDFLWRAERLNVEVDGGQHDDPAQRADDEKRDREARARDYRVMRFRADFVWRHPTRVVNAIVAALRGDPIRPAR